MGRRRRKKGETVSLFPFLSILSCLIGSLTLMISTMAMVQIDPSEADDPEKAKRADEFALLEQQLKKDEELLKTLQEKINREQKGLKDAVLQQENLLNLEKKIAELKKQLKLKEKLIVEKNTKAKQQETWKLELHKISEDHKRLAVQEKELLIELDKKKEELSERKAKPKEAEVKILPGGSGVKVNPFFIECNKQGLVLLDESKQPRILRKEIRKDERLLKLLEQVKKNEQNSIVFLIRPDGVSTYYDANKWANENYARNGKLPILGQGHIDLSLMNKKP